MRLWLGVLLLAALFAAAGFADAEVALAQDNDYTNPLPVVTPGGMAVESCADPTVVRDAAAEGAGESVWYMACTTDPLSGSDRDAAGNLIFHLVPLFRSTDLIRWTYIGDAFSSRPDWVADDAGLWAPSLEYFNGQYYLYYTAPNTDLPGGGSAIGVATAPSPEGPWTDSGAPAVEPHAPPCCPTDRRWTFDPAIIADGARPYARDLAFRRDRLLRLVPGAPEPVVRRIRATVRLIDRARAAAPGCVRFRVHARGGSVTLVPLQQAAAQSSGLLLAHTLPLG